MHVDHGLLGDHEQLSVRAADEDRLDDVDEDHSASGRADLDECSSGELCFEQHHAVRSARCRSAGWHRDKLVWDLLPAEPDASEYLGCSGLHWRDVQHADREVHILLPGHRPGGGPGNPDLHSR